MAQGPAQPAAAVAVTSIPIDDDPVLTELRKITLLLRLIAEGLDVKITDTDLDEVARP